MTILTLNLHCYAEENILENQLRIVDAMIDHEVDVVCFQEACQHKEKCYVKDLQKQLQARGHHYEYVFESSNIAFDKYDEGIAILSRLKIVNSRVTKISKTQDYHDWKTRIAIHADVLWSDDVVRITSVHFGWTDEIEVFETQFDTLYGHLDKQMTHIICGDYNIDEKSQEYRYVTKHLYDLWDIKAQQRSSTHIDKRIDYVMSLQKLDVKKQHVLFCEEGNRVSDHCGVLMMLDFK